MISRIRMDAYGRSPADVADTLYPHADLIEEMLGVSVGRGEFVVERNLAEPDGVFAFKGRLILHPSLNFDDMVEPPAVTATTGLQGAGYPRRADSPLPVA